MITLMNQNKYIVSLTTIPSKFDNLHLTIDSIVNQTVLPDKIIVNIPNVYNFRMNSTSISEDKINDFVDKYPNVIVNRLDQDFGPGTKLLGLFHSNLIEPDNNTYIVLVDDDLVYKPYMIEYFDNYIKQNPNIEIASFYVYNHEHINVGQGADGFFIKQNTLTHFLQYYNEIKEEDYIHYHDDFYISYYFHLIDKQIRFIQPPHHCLIYDLSINSDIDALRLLEGKYSRGNLNAKSTEILNNLKNNKRFDFLSFI
jgi:GT2 family glycosyltransferase